MNHSFTAKIIEEVGREFNELGRTIFELSPLLQYIDKKTRSANRGSKARSSFANLYALYDLPAEERREKVERDVVAFCQSAFV